MGKDANKKRGMALKIVRQAEAQSFGVHGDSAPSVAIVANNLFSGHRNLFMIQGINALMTNPLPMDLCVYLHDTAVPMIAPHFPIFPVHMLCEWTGGIIATDVTTCLDAIGSSASKIVHYVFDLETDRRDLDHAQIVSAYRNPRVTVVTRCTDHWEVLCEEYGLDGRSVAVPDFDLAVLLQILGER